MIWAAVISQAKKSERSINMATFSNKLKSYLGEFYVREIMGDLLYGITYAFVPKEPRSSEDDSRYKNYVSIRDEASRCGYPKDKVFIMYETSNGYVFDMDMNVAQQIATELAKGVPDDAEFSPKEFQELIAEAPVTKRKKDMARLAKYCLDQAEAGKEQFEIALFSTNMSGKITVTGEVPKHGKVCVAYTAYALRHVDIEAVNEHLLIPKGYKISKMQSGEILPLKNGISFIVTLERLQPKK